jgi:CBS domain-containing protein
MTTMQVKDIMSRNVIWVGTDESVLRAVQLMLQNHISGLPVIDMNGELAGIVTEGDFLRRSELGTERHRSRWLELLVGPGKLAAEYVHASGRKIEEVMTRDPYTVSESDTLEKVVELMEQHHIKRLPVTRDGKVVGIVSRANLMREMAHQLRPDMQASAGPDWWIRGEIISALGKQDWAPDVTIQVRNGIVGLSGVILNENERQAIIVAAENVPGVKEVHDHLVWVEPNSAMAFPSPEDEKAERVSTP